MRSANQFETFSEYWCYSSWVAAKAPADLAFHPYEEYGASTERFFDDGTGLFSTTLQKKLGLADSVDGTDPTHIIQKAMKISTVSNSVAQGFPVELKLSR